MIFGRIRNRLSTRAISQSRGARPESPGVATPGLWLAMFCVILACSNPVLAQRRVGTIFPERRSIQVREPHQLPRYQMPTALAPSTVSRPIADLEPQLLALDGSIRTSMRNLDVVRVLSGVTASNSGRSIYDIALTNTQIDQQQARFDPLLSVDNAWNILENPQAIFDPLPPNNPLITGAQTRNFNTSTRLSKTDLTGGNFVFGVDATPSHTHPGTFPLDPLTRSSTFVSYTQPLLKGGGIEFNLAPIVIAQISTERSYFQFKDAMQEHVRGVIEAYWSLVAARTDLWARKQQAEQLQETVRRVEARVRNAIDNRADLAQAQLALANIKASVVTAQGNVLLREAALRNMIGVSPSDGTLYIPTTPPINDRFIPDWDQMLQLAEERRPDLIELKLILEADTQQLLIAKNSSRPQLDAVALYRWNGLSGITPTGSRLSTSPGQFTDWTLGVNFSVPLGLRQARATVRQQELVIARDQINLKQGFHATTHILVATVRTLDQQYEQYLALREARQAARVNLDAQLLRWQTGQAILLNVLQAISDWGNTVSAEASALTQYNTQLATLERQTGTILETHGIYFVQESQQAIGPHGRFCDTRCYPWHTRPTENNDLYDDSTEPAENSFDLTPPTDIGAAPKDVPYDTIELPTLEEIMRKQKLEDAEPPP
jgi:outer membrane protein TolC